MTKDSLLGLQLDEYRLEAVLGRGGMASVYSALDVRLNRRAAIKVIAAPMRSNPARVARFEREARAIAQLNHPNIVTIYRFGEVAGLSYIAMQFVEGADLESVLESYAAAGEYVSPADAARIVRDIGAALDYAHARGVIHRDVKPANVMLDLQGRAILTDFGLALLTDMGTHGDILGSPHYLAPEQARSSADAVPQSDLYSAGVILYEMLTGRVPFDAEQPLEIARLHVTAAPPLPRALRPEISPAVEAVALKALAKDPEARYASGAALAEALEQALQAQRMQAPLDPPPAVLFDRIAACSAQRTLAPVTSASPTEMSEPATEDLASATAPMPGAGPPPSSGRRYLYAGLGVGVGGFLLFLTFAGAIAFALINARLRPAAEAVQLATATTPAETPPPSPPPPPTAAPPITYSLLLVKNDDHFILVNLGPEALALAPLQLGDGRGALTGSAWGLEALPAGACLTASRGDDADDARLPRGLECERVGQLLNREQRFWRGNFNVYYDGDRIGACRRQEDQCRVEIVVE